MLLPIRSATAYAYIVRGKGGGPKTAGGKAASSRNSIKHGLRSGAPVIPELESFEEWERHRAGTIESLAPEGYFETDLAERIALLSWRLKRVARYETEMTAVNLDDIPDDLARHAIFRERVLKIPGDVTITPEAIDEQFIRRLLPPAQILERIMRYEAHLHRQLVQTIHELEAVQARRRGERTPLARLDVTRSSVV